MRHTLFIFCLLCTYITTQAQISDLARIEYVGIPGSGEGVTYDRYRAMVNYPIEVKKDTYFLVGLDYSYINLEIEEALVPFDPEPLNRFQLLDLNVGYTYKMKNDWRFAARLAPGFSSNLTASKLSFEDVAFSADVVFIKNKKKVELPQKPTQLILGVSVSNNRGFPILPFISYYKKFHPKWSYNLGVPKSNIQWHMHQNHRLKAVVRLDGFSGNLQNGFAVNESIADRFRIRLLVGGLRYEYKCTKNLEFYINGSYIIDSNVVLQEGTQNSLLEITDRGTAYVKTGVRFKV